MQWRGTWSTALTSRNRREGRNVGHAAGKEVRRGLRVLRKQVRSAEARAVLRARRARRNDVLKSSL